MKALFTTCVALAGIGAAIAQTASPAHPAGEKRTHFWCRDRPAGGQSYRTNSKELPLISIKGNHHVVRRQLELTLIPGEL
jgi:hypothetical protein